MFTCELGTKNTACLHSTGRAVDVPEALVNEINEMPLLAFVVFLLLSGCAYGPDAKNPTCISRCYSDVSEIKNNPALATLTNSEGAVSGTSSRSSTITETETDSNDTTVSTSR